MRRTSLLASVSACALAAALLPAPAAGQKLPKISTRMYAGGSATLTVTGSFRVDQDVALNKVASFSDGDYTWLQFGASGSDSANVLVTIGDGIGIGPGLGKNTAIAEGDHCKGTLEVSASAVSGTYTCTGVTSYNTSTRKMGTIDLKIRFTAKTADKVGLL